MTDMIWLLLELRMFFFSVRHKGAIAYFLRTGFVAPFRDSIPITCASVANSSFLSARREGRKKDTVEIVNLAFSAHRNNMSLPVLAVPASIFFFLTLLLPCEVPSCCSHLLFSYVLSSTRLLL